MRIRRPYRLPIAAASTLFGLAAAFCVSAEAPAGAATGSATVPHAAVVDITYQPSASHAKLMSLVQQVAARKATSGLPTWYTVRSDDSLASIAKRFYHNPAAWPVLYLANHRQIHGPDAIKAGQVLRVPVKPARIPNLPALHGPAAALVPAPLHASAVPVQAAPVQAAPVKAAPAATYSGSGSFRSCVIGRESGGSSQAMNGSGHYGLYQFSASTWAAYGGSPSAFGSASVAQQNQVFSNAMAAGGASNWSSYDGC